MSLLRLDHVVIAVADLERAIGLCTQAGFTVLPGGRHPGRNTRNALIVFEDGAYLELITYAAPSPDERWWRELEAHGNGLVDFALLPQDLPGAIAQAQARGLADIQGPLPGSRDRPDGVHLACRRHGKRTMTCPSCALTSPRVRCGCRKARCAATATARGGSRQ